MEIKKIKISDLHPYKGNAKEHPQEQIEQIKNSIIMFGNNDPIAVDENNVIIEGHGRYEALKQLNYEKVDVIVLTGLTEDEKNAYRIVHNQLTMNSGWDMDRLKEELSKIENIDLAALGIDESMLDDIENEHKSVEEDSDFDINEALEEIVEPTSKLGDIYQLGRHRLMCGDSTSEKMVSKLMNGELADLLLTDPPYNVAYEGGTDEALTIQNDNMSENEFVSFLYKAFENADKSLKKGAAFYIWHASRTQKEFEETIPWEIRQQLIWNKNALIIGRQDYQWKHEPCFYGWKEGAPHHWYSDRSQTTILDFNKPARNDVHPTMKPLDLIGYQIQNSSKENDIVLDLFGGSGSTLIACEQLNRVCYMMELDPKYCDVIIKRWEQLTGEKTKKIN